MQLSVCPYTLKCLAVFTAQMHFDLIGYMLAEPLHCAPSALQNSIQVTHTHFDHINECYGASNSSALCSWQDPRNTMVECFGGMISP